MTWIPLARPAIGEAELEAQAHVLRSGRLVLGPENAALESALANAVGLPHAITLASGTAALYCALAALGLERGLEVIVPAFTFPAPAHVVLALGLTAVPADVDEATWNISPEAVRRFLTPKTGAILAVDQFGLCSDYAALTALAHERGIPLIEDAACALGASINGRPVGSSATIACMSFHPRKIMTTGEGGAVVTRDDKLAESVRAQRNHGQSSPGVFAFAGLNHRMPETCAAIGRVQLGRLEAFIEERARLVLAYKSRLAPLRLRMQRPGPEFRHVWQTFAVVLPKGTDRAQIILELRARDIEAGVATYALHRIGSFAGWPGFTRTALPVADYLHDQALALPLWNGMSEGDIDRVAHALMELLS